MSLPRPDRTVWAIETAGISKSFGFLPALRDITLQIARQQCVSILGPNGAGKSTLIRILSTLIQPSAGSAWIDGWNIRDHPSEVRRRVGFAAHQPMLYGDLSATENLLFYARMFGVQAPQERIRNLLNQAELYGRRDDPVRTLSRGMQQRLTIARCLLHNPSILLLDEPYTGLDQRAAAILNDLLHQLLIEGHTVLLTTHDVEWAAGIVDQLLILTRGRLVYQCSVKDSSPQTLRETYQRYAGER
jgi:heme exporter protein A